MTKDWKAECDKLRGELKQLKEQVEHDRRFRERLSDQERALRNTFKELLLDVLGNK